MDAFFNARNRELEEEMELNQFRFELNQVDFFQLKNEWWMYRKPVEIWNEKTDESFRFKDLYSALEFMVDGESVEDIIAQMEHIPIIDIEGGRGAGSGGMKTYSPGFGTPGPDNSNRLLPAQMNTKIKSKTPEAAIAEFNKKHQNADHEWAVEVDDQGFVHQYVEGERHSVGIGGSNTSRNRKTLIVHNHPSGGHFSGNDLMNVAQNRRSNGVIASPKGKNYYYKFERGPHFDSKAFMKDFPHAQMKGKSYDDAMDKWLRSNAKKYGYKYSKVKK